MRAEDTIIYKSMFYGLICLTGKAGGQHWFYYETACSLAEKLGMSNPYRNPDRTLARLIYEEIRSN
ncbi:hypothetical protein ES704_01971 [subsurface metagenome]